MSLMSVLKKDIGGKKRTPESETPTTEQVSADVVIGPEESPKPKFSRKGGQAAAIPAFAVSPRADLLPPEIGQNHRKRATRRGLRFLVIAVVVVVLVGTGGAWFAAYSAQAALEAAQEEQNALLVEQAQYADVRSTLNSIALGTAAREVGSSTEIDWSGYLGQLQSTLPSEVSLVDVSVDAADPITAYGQSTVPLEGARIATLSFTAESPVLPSIPDWVNRLSSLPGFADASPKSVSFSDGIYSATVTMHINEEAYSGRFVKPETEESE